MLTQNDINVMKEDVRDIIDMWDTTLDIYLPLPIEQQSNWNPILCEYTGAVNYNILLNVHAERKDIQNMSLHDEDATNAGDYDNGKLAFAVSDEVPITTDCIIKYDGNDWRIDMIRRRIGENIIIINRNVGDNNV